MAVWRDVAAQRFSRRWLLVAAGAAGLVAAGAVPWPAGAVDVDATALRRRILGSVPPHVGYAESTGRLGLPQIPQLESAIALFTSTTRIRAFVAGSDRWRVDQLTPAGERDTYRLDGVEYVWDFGGDQLTRVVGEAPIRLPRAADLLPPELARRLLRLAPADPVTTLPARRVAGRTAMGLRLTPSDPATTIGTVDIWADPATALPLRVEVAPHTGPPLLTSELLEVDDRTPDPSELTPAVPPGAATVSTSAADVSGALRQLDAPPPPAQLAGRSRMPLSGTPDARLPGVGIYGTGLAAFALIPATADLAGRVVDNAAVAGGTMVEVPSGRAVRLATPLVSVAARTSRRSGVLLIGTVVPELLEQAVRELPARRRRA
ncbi:hypothetical protein [Pseudonocardia xinjiangensis]|uniref:hypothetical protein n=1 Tax=Pseudonocardia xinjiangensis TaxID=75289 RepID=UPI001B7D01F0|nr:hypothetical protein [Pseudonocardia xinjiangensis]